MHPLRQAQHPNPPNTRAQKQKKNSQRKGGARRNAKNFIRGIRTNYLADLDCTEVTRMF